ncbi:MAG: hypothetical protein ACRD2H_10550 [Terriglobales bacterium]
MTGATLFDVRLLDGPLPPLLLVPEKSLLYFTNFSGGANLSGDGSIEALNYHTESHETVVSGIAPGYGARCGGMLVFWQLGPRKPDDALVLPIAGGKPVFVSARGYTLWYDACSSGVAYFAGGKGWRNPLTEGYHLTDARLFRYDPRSSRLDRATRSFLNTDRGVGFAVNAILSRWPKKQDLDVRLVALTDDSACEIAGTAAHWQELFGNRLCREPASDIQDAFAKQEKPRP